LASKISDNFDKECQITSATIWST